MVAANSQAYSIDTLTKQVPAIVEGWYQGQETGSSIADVLFGDVHPSGSLPVSIARNVGQLPISYYYKTTIRTGVRSSVPSSRTIGALKDIDG